MGDATRAAQGASASGGWEVALEACLGELLVALVEVWKQEGGALDADGLRGQLRAALGSLLGTLRSELDPAYSLSGLCTELRQALATVAAGRALEPGLAALQAQLTLALRHATEAARAGVHAVLEGRAPSAEVLASQLQLRCHPALTPPLLPEVGLGGAGSEAEATSGASPFQGALARLAAQAKVERQLASPDEAGPLPPVSAVDFRRGLAQLCLDEVAMLLSQRAPQLGEAWHGVWVYEARIFECVDAARALGRDALQHLEQVVLDALASDPAAVAALTVLCGSVQGRDALALAEWVYRRSEQSEELTRAFFEALALVPHPSVTALAERVLAGGAAGERALALDVLARQGALTRAHLEAALEQDAPLQAVALRLLARQGAPDLREHVEDALFSAEPERVRAAWYAMTLSGDPRAAVELQRALSSEDSATREDAALWLAVCGARADAERLLAEAVSAPSPVMMEALGISGYVPAVPFLMGQLAVDDFELQLAAAFALRRITGWELWEVVELPPERVMDGGAATDGLALEGAVGDERVVSDAGSPDTLELPSLRQEPWSLAWEEAGGQFDPALRYRRGQPSTPHVLLDELERHSGPARERELLWLELSARSGLALALDVRGWVPAQRQALQGWRDALAPSANPGSWWVPRRR